MTIFKLGDFTLASGARSDFKIDCDDLTDDDLAALARIGSKLLRPFSHVHGVPTGGERFARAMSEYIDEDSAGCLIVDDVFTTGGSITAVRDSLGEQGVLCQGLVIFSRVALMPWWITSIFRMGEPV